MFLLRWLKQTYLWEKNDVTDDDNTAIDRERRVDSPHKSKDIYRPSRHLCYYNPDLRLTDGQGNTHKRERRRHRKRRKKKEVRQIVVMGFQTCSRIEMQLPTSKLDLTVNNLTYLKT